HMPADLSEDPHHALVGAGSSTVAEPRTYGQPNSASDIDEPGVKGTIEFRPAGGALDAACGTGR
ncbi:hypothetical protein K7G98_43445, partial [Saccharothrix sp. MB29]|nr:hypothetical protein [Saccharothrix sp. MB29]